MSLWAVDDASTSAWMAQLYQARLTQNLATDQAVRSACRALLAERHQRGLDTHPFHWAAFVASGDWR
jgi:CHAT domain-containing protein